MECILQVRGEDLDGQTALREQDQLQVVAEKLERHASCFGEIGPSNAKLRVHDRRVHEQKELLAARGAAPLNELERKAGQALSKLAGIGVRRSRRTAGSRTASPSVDDAAGCRSAPCRDC